jgi:hypothetical protein
LIFELSIKTIKNDKTITNGKTNIHQKSNLSAANPKCFYNFSILFSQELIKIERERFSFYICCNSLDIL